MTDFITETQTYLQRFFHSINAHATACNVSVEDLTHLIAQGQYPNASYKVQHQFHCTSFVADTTQQSAKDWHKISHQKWHQTLVQEHVQSEQQAFELFSAHYLTAHHQHFKNPIGQAMQHMWPAIANPPEQEFLKSSWSYFKQGVYGVCTRDGLPATIFKKQYGVKFIDHMMTQQRGLSPAETGQICHIIDWLDEAAAPFAPHEVANSSRQRCIINARKHFHLPITADKIAQ